MNTPDNSALGAMFALTKPKNKQDLFSNILMIGKVYVNYFWPRMEFLLRERNKFLPPNKDPDKFYLLSEAAIVLFFAHIESTALSFRTLMDDALKCDLLHPLSNGQKKLITKNSNLLGFDDLMKIQFSILPRSLGVESNYGEFKEKSLSLLYLMREIRNNIVHPDGIQDIGNDLLKPLDGKDINAAMIEYAEGLQEVMHKCAVSLVPKEKQTKASGMYLFGK